MTSDEPDCANLRLAAEILITLDAKLPQYGSDYYSDYRQHVLAMALQGTPPATWGELAQRVKTFMDSSPSLRNPGTSGMYRLLLARGDTPFEFPTVMPDAGISPEPP